MYKTRVLIISERKELSIKYKKLIEALKQDVAITNDLSCALSIIQKQENEFIVISDTIKEKLSVTSRCMPFEQEEISDTCVCCGKKAQKMVYWGKAY